jgi:hypothetical protein
LKKYTVKRYNKEDYNHWNDFVSNAKNATFLFHRDFMEYHSDRFEDFSLIILDGEKWVAILPANSIENTVYSHQGLTYGGLVLLEKSKISHAVLILKALLKYLNDNIIEKLFIKSMPSVYCKYPSDEVNYLSHICNATTIMKHNISVIPLKNELQISKSRRECINRGKKLGLIIKEESNLESFWNELLIPNLKQKYNTKPVHSIEEIMFLKSKFPENIKHFNVFNDDKLVCGTTVFITENVIKPQYVAGSEDNNALGSLDFLYHFLITENSKNKLYFDFGPSHNNNGLEIVTAINFWKESFGAHSVVQDFYEIETENYFMLDGILK